MTVSWVVSGTGHGLALCDFHARMYDPATGRWLVPDPAEQFANPYLAMGNNPVSYIDPDGEWAHIVIGAAVGGTLNWAFNGAQFNAQGLGYFGVGALAGGLAAGVGAGVGAAIAGNAAAGGGFAAGFVGSATLGSTRFAAGATTGAMAGITNGLIQGTGNAMLGGQSFGVALFGNGMNQALKQGLSGAALGGIMGGIQSAQNGGGFFESGTVKTTVIKNDVQRLKQNGDQNCLPTAGEAMAKASGIDLPQEQIRNGLGGSPHLDPIDDSDFAAWYGNQTKGNWTILGPGDFDRSSLHSAMKDGSQVVLTRKDLLPDRTIQGHALVLKKSTQKVFNFASSKTIHSYRFQVMNPAFGIFQGLQWDGVTYYMMEFLR
ncbi:MAG: RHS repeat-associated core domain-containing protein [Flavobacteriales bacterium]